MSPKEVTANVTTSQINQNSHKKKKSNKKAPKRSIQAKFKDNLSGRGTRTRTLGTWFWSKRTDFQKANKINKLTTIATKTADYSTTAEPNFEKQILQL